jgi:hypothetical protein
MISEEVTKQKHVVSSRNERSSSSVDISLIKDGSREGDESNSDFLKSKDDPSLNIGSSHHGSTSEQSHSFDENSRSNIKNQIARGETRSVSLFKFLVLAILVVVAVVVSYVIYNVTTSSETEEFRQQYDGVASKIVDTYESIVERIGTISTIGTAATIHGQDHKNIKWPFVTLTSFQERCATAKQVSGVLHVAVNPIVAESDRTAWEKYSVGADRSWM